MKHFKENLFIKIIFSGLLIPALLLVVSLTSARSEARVYLQPVDMVDPTVTVDVVVDNVTNLYGAEFRLKYDPAILSPQDVSDQEDGIQVDIGNLLSADQVYIVANEVDETQGIITFAVTLLNPAPPINERGSMARVNFNILQDGPATIELEHAKLVAFDLETIPSDKTSLAISRQSIVVSDDNDNAQLTVGDEAASSPVIRSKKRPMRTAVINHTYVESNDISWWQVAAVLVMMGGVSALGLVLLLGSGSLVVATAVQKNKLQRHRV